MKLYIATGNAHKVQEFQRILIEKFPDIEVLSANELGGMPDVDENENTFEGNAFLKARALFKKSKGHPVLADDSGLCVDALQGAPGIYSARYAGAGASDAENREKLLDALRNIPPENRSAHFCCVLAFVDAQGSEHAFSGECHGFITVQEQGVGGFGYDPVFQPVGFSETFGELSAEIKNQLSHRGKALEAFSGYLANLSSGR